MIDKKYRDEVFKNNSPYMDDKDTVEDLLSCCKVSCPYCPKTLSKEWCGKIKGTCPIFNLWLSNEYLEWADSYR